MLFLWRIPKLIRWITVIVLLIIICLTMYRFFFYLKYNPSNKAFSGSAFLMGLRFDAKFASIIGLSILALCAFPFLHPFKNLKAAKFWNIILPLVFVILFIFLGADYFHFDYLRQRLNASVLNYLEDAGISFGMMWQTYPVVKVLIALVILAILTWLVCSRLLLHYQTKYSFYKRKGIVQHIAFFIVLAALTFGKFSQYPLRWSDAFTLSDDFKGNLALNPLQSFFSTLKFRKGNIDINKVKAAYPLLAQQLGIPKFDSINLNYQRIYNVADTVNTKPNIILVICESFSAYKSSMYNNALNTTPFFNELCNKGIFFDRCFTPSYGTARGVWATITGIPDVESPKTASRNPLAVNQHTIINNFKGYDKYYFLGGDPTWANIQGLLANNIEGLKLYQQENFKAKKIDVWGISDKNLFLEANGILKENTKPFFAIIQTADNHRPYTIPKEDENAFKKLNFPKDSLNKYGFESNEEVNAFRYTDFCFQQFMEAAKKEKYFNNTIFVFIGDHGIKGNATQLPKTFTEQGLTAEHVPLLFYSPKFNTPKRINTICSQVDVLPSIAGITNSSYINTTLGRNLFDSANKAANLAFIYDDLLHTIGIVDKDYYYLYNFSANTKSLYSITNNEVVQKTQGTDSFLQSMHTITTAYYETAKYMLLNNKKK
jgi:phosphoglycerol transferase MdoB-like AlkP superfamily enzyme